MNYFRFRWKLFPILLVVSAYFFVQFFGTVAGVDMFSVIRWGLGSGGEVGKGFPVFLLLLIPAVFYLMAFMAVFVFLETPAQILQLKGYHAGGLLGYQDGWKVHVYDPDQGRYVEYRNFTPPPAAKTFKKAFPVVLFYRYRPSSNLHRDTSLLGPGFYLASLLTAAVSLFMVYMTLYLLAAEYLEAGDPPIELTHQLMASRFQEVTGLAPLQALWIVLAVYALGMAAGMISVRVLVHQYKSRYVSQRDELRYALMQRVSPGGTIRGTVVRRHYEEQQYRDTSSAVGRAGRWRTQRWPVFTVEFTGLIRVPVYLHLTTRPSERALEDEARLQRLFPDPRSVVPKESPEFEFVVNPDYSISLAGTIGV
jgi:hypothetical protein